MHTKVHSHYPTFGASWSPASVALTILITLLFLIFLFVFLTLTAQPAQGQSPLTSSQPSCGMSRHSLASREPSLACFQAGGSLQILHNFTSNEGQGGGVTVDAAGNLYGVTSGGNNGLGMVYKLASRGQDWLFTPLYSFAGGAGGQGPSPVTIGPDGALYGAAGDGSYGLIFRLRPSPVAASAALGPWQEEVIYTFNGESDGEYPSGILTFDSAGNLYGVAQGGSNNLGSVFELTPSRNDWTEQIIFSLSGGNDGYAITSLLAGKDGNLYVTSNGTDPNCNQWYGPCGVILQLAPTMNGWVENDIYSFENQNDGHTPMNLSQDGAGNLYGNSIVGISGGGYDCYWTDCYGVVFELSPSSQGWVFRLLYSTGHYESHYYTIIESFTADANGNTYPSSVGYEWDNNGCGWAWGGGEIGMDGNELWGTGNWFETTSRSGAALPLAVDSSYVYGTTSFCGSYGEGTVWSVGIGHP